MSTAIRAQLLWKFFFQSSEKIFFKIIKFI